ncbi:UDP-galactopyranose mutase [Pedobacter sp. PWIIR3]
MKRYDFLIVGAGLFGAVFAHEMKKAGKKCLVIDKRRHSGGNTFCENIEGINVHCYGAHIFHTDSKEIWNYVNSFVEFNRYTNSPIAVFNGEIYNLPFNMNTFYKLWGVSKPDDAKKIIEHQTKSYQSKNPRNLEEQALALVGEDIYSRLIKGYTEKQWGRPATELPPSLIKRIPLRYTFNNNYFNDRYQGIPIGGYNKLTNALLQDIEIKLDVDFFESRDELEKLADKIIYSGKIDEYFDYKFGHLEYRSLKFKHKHLGVSDFQGNAVVNFTANDIPYTRIIEHKHFEFGNQKTTIITEEYPSYHDATNEPYYPINNMQNDIIYGKYKSLADGLENVIFGGRLGEFRYYDMHQVIGSALNKAKKCLLNHKGC